MDCDLRMEGDRWGWCGERSPSSAGNSMTSSSSSLAALSYSSESSCTSALRYSSPMSKWGIFILVASLNA